MRAEAEMREAHEKMIRARSPEVKAAEAAFTKEGLSHPSTRALHAILAETARVRRETRDESAALEAVLRRIEQIARTDSDTSRLYHARLLCDIASIASAALISPQAGEEKDRATRRSTMAFALGGDPLDRAVTPKYSVPMGDPLDMLVEECAEVIQEMMKVRRFGMGGSPEWIARGEDPPRKRLIQEIGDVLAIVDLVMVRGIFTSAELAAAQSKKMACLTELFGADALERTAKESES